MIHLWLPSSNGSIERMKCEYRLLKNAKPSLSVFQAIPMMITMDGFSYEGNRAVYDRRAPEGGSVTAIIARLLLKEWSLSGSSAGT